MSEESEHAEKPKEASHHITHKEKKAWYKHWWGVLVALCILPLFLLWYTWGKAKWPKAVKLIVTAVIALFCIGVVASGGQGSNTAASTNTAQTSTSSSASTGNTSTTTPATSTPGLNQQANDGKLGFTVTSFKCGISEIDQPGDTTGDFTATSGAPYCEMDLTVKGVSNVAQDFDDSAQYVYSNGKQYSVDDDATIYANDAGNNCMDLPTVNPGISITCTLAFDVPAVTTPSYAMLHDSSFSNGVKVDLQ